MVTIGIDSGKDGAIVVLEAASPSPIVLAQVLLRTVDLESPQAVAELLRSLPRPDRVAMELGQSPRAPGKSIGSAMYRTGVRWGTLHALVSVLWTGAALWTPTPQTWQKVILADTAGEGKERAIGVAQQRLPGLDLTPGRIRQRHDGLADAGCLALWAAERKIK